MRRILPAPFSRFGSRRKTGGRTRGLRPGKDLGFGKEGRAPCLSARSLVWFWSRPGSDRPRRAGRRPLRRLLLRRRCRPTPRRRKRRRRLLRLRRRRPSPRLRHRRPSPRLRYRRGRPRLRRRRGRLRRCRRARRGRSRPCFPRRSSQARPHPHCCRPSCRSLLLRLPHRDARRSVGSAAPAASPLEPGINLTRRSQEPARPGSLSPCGSARSGPAAWP